MASTAKMEIHLPTGAGKTQSSIFVRQDLMPDERPWFQFSDARTAFAYRLNHDKALRKEYEARLARVLGDVSKRKKLEEWLNTPSNIKIANLRCQTGFEKARSDHAEKTTRLGPSGRK